MSSIQTTPRTIIETDRVTSTVHVTDIITGDSPALLVTERAFNPISGARLVTQKIPVPDKALFARLLTEAEKGTLILAITETEWYEDGYVTHLADFSVIDQAVSAPRAMAATAAS